MPLFAERFTIADLEAYPDDGQHRELLDGAFLVTPLAASRHQLLVARLFQQVAAFVASQRIGVALTPGRMVIDDHTALEPDVLVVPGGDAVALRDWKDHPAPLLVVEVVSPASRAFDYLLKRAAYERRGAGEYWIVDAVRREMTIARPGVSDRKITDAYSWEPPGTEGALVVDVRALFSGLPLEERV